jgi:DNA ligase 1
MIKPMLAASTNRNSIPKLFNGTEYLMSYKFDGIRCLNIDNIPTSRSGKAMRNLYLQDIFLQLPSDIIFDGELLIPNEDNTFSSNTDGIMTINKKLPYVKYYIFDIVSDKTAKERYEYLLSIKNSLPDWCVIVDKIPTTKYQEYLDFYQHSISIGYEGVMLQLINGKYKQGRSTLNEKYLIKTKEIVTLEAIIIGHTQKTINHNESLPDDLGYSKKSSAKAGLEYVDQLGAFVCETIKSDYFEEGIVFKIGTGFTDAERTDIWKNIDDYIGKIAIFKTLIVGVLEAPRNPSFVGFRDIDDL